MLLENPISEVLD